MKNTNTKQKLFEMMSKVDKSFKPNLNEDILDSNGEISDLTILQSGAGYYIGRTQEPYGFPYSRESDYFPDKESAQIELNRINSKKIQ